MQQKKNAFQKLVWKTLILPHQNMCYSAFVMFPFVKCSVYLSIFNCIFKSVNSPPYLEKIFGCKNKILGF